MNPTRPSRRAEFEIAIICALTIEADAVEALFDKYWDDDGPPYDKASGDPNAYSTGSIGRHNVVLAHMPGMGKANASLVAANCRNSFPNIKLAIVVGVCGVVPFISGDGKKREIVLGDVIMSTGVVQYDFGRQLPEHFIRKDTLLDSLGRPNTEIRGLLGKLQGVRGRKTLQGKLIDYLSVIQNEPELAAEYPGVQRDCLFMPTYRHTRDGVSCEDCGCNGEQVSRDRLDASSNPTPMVHFGLVASGDTVMKSAEQRDVIAQYEGIVAFEMEGAGVWDTFPCVVVKGACDYADSHKTKAWQRYAAATAAACAKAFLAQWVPSKSVLSDQVKNSLVDDRSQAPEASHFLVPFPKNKNFVGRESILTRLKDGLFGDDSSRSMAVIGLGGIGKTQVALQIAYHAKSLDGWSVFWLSALSMTAFEQACSDMAQKVGVLGAGAKDSKQIVKEYLESSSSAQWLLVVDNADDMTDMLHPGGICAYLPANVNGRTLFTTRSMDVALAVADYNSEELDKMSEKEARDFLHKLLPQNQADDQTRTELVRTLTFLPLAISQAAAYIKRNKIPVTKYLTLLQDVDKEAIGLLSREFSDPMRYRESRHAVATTWLISFEQIQKTDEAAAEILSFISQIESRAIPLSILPRSSTEERIEHAVGTLCGYAFVTRREDGELLDMHSLVHLAAREWVSHEGRADQIKRHVVGHLATVFKSSRWEDRAVWRKYLVHVLKAIQGSSDAKTWEEDQYLLAYWAAQCLIQEGRDSEAVQLLEQLVKARETMQAEDSSERLDVQFYLALAYSRNGQVKQAVRLHEHVAKIRGEMLPNDDPDLLESQEELAIAYEADGQGERAVQLLEHVVRVKEMNLEESDPDRIRSQSTLASVYQDTGRIGKAVKLLEHVVKMEAMALAEDHPDLLNSQHELARAYTKNGQMGKALDLLERVVQIYEKVLPATHPDRLASQSVLARAYEQSGRLEEAIKLFEYVVKVEGTTLAEDHPDRLSSQHELARLYRDNGQVEEAVKLLEHVVKVRETTLAEDHPDQLGSQHVLACIYGENGRVEEAVKLLEHVVKVRETSLAEDHPDRLSSQHELARLYGDNGRVEEAVKLLEHVVKVEQTTLAEDHPDRLSSQHELARLYGDNGRVEEAVKLLEHVVKVRETSLAEDHPHRLSSQHNLARQYRKNGQVEEGIELLEHVVSVESKVLDPADPKRRMSEDLLKEFLASRDGEDDSDCDSRSESSSLEASKA